MSHPYEIDTPCTFQRNPNGPGFLIHDCSGFSLGIIYREDTAHRIVDCINGAEPADTQKIASLEADNKAAWATNRAIDVARQEEMRRRDQLTEDIDALKTTVINLLDILRRWEPDWSSAEDRQQIVQAMYQVGILTDPTKTVAAMKVGAGVTAPYHDHSPSRGCNCPACTTYFLDKPIGCDFVARKGGA